MPLVVAGCLFVVFLVFLLVHRKREYALLCALAASLVMYLAFMLIYIAKKGGIGGLLSDLLFITDGFRRRLQYLQLTLRQLGYGMAVGRYLFPWLFLLLALQSGETAHLGRRNRRWYLTAVLPVVTLVLYHPEVFTRVARTETAQWLAVNLSMGWILLYLLAGGILLLYQSYGVRIPYVRIRILLRCVMLISIAAMYLLYCPQDPAQVYLFYQGGYMAGRGLWYLNPYLSAGTYMVVLAVNGVALLLGSVSMVALARVEWSVNQDDVRMQRQYDALSVGGTVFVHGIKNQLLANRVLCRRLNEQLAADEPDLERVRAYARQLSENNTGVLQHVEELYKSFRSNALSMRQCRLEEIVTAAAEGLHKKYPEAVLTLQPVPELYILADPAHLRAALVNLLVNGWEATVAARRTDALEVSFRETGRAIWICVQDHGTGIGKYDLKRIFDPFFSSKNSKSNWGLGLYYVQTIVKKHMGGVRVETDPSKGTRFYLYLPKLLPEKKWLRQKEEGGR